MLGLAMRECSEVVSRVQAPISMPGASHIGPVPALKNVQDKAPVLQIAQYREEVSGALEKSTGLHLLNNLQDQDLTGKLDRQGEHGLSQE